MDLSQYFYNDMKIEEVKENDENDLNIDGVDSFMNAAPVSNRRLQ